MPGKFLFICLGDCYDGLVFRILSPTEILQNVLELLSTYKVLAGICVLDEKLKSEHFVGLLHCQEIKADPYVPSSPIALGYAHH